MDEHVRYGRARPVVTASPGSTRVTSVKQVKIKSCDGLYLNLTYNVWRPLSYF